MSSGGLISIQIPALNRGSEQAGTRPVLILQRDVLSKFTTSVLAVPLTTNLRRSGLPSAVLIREPGTGLPHDSVALCHQLRVLDKSRLYRRFGSIAPDVLLQVETALLFTLGFSPI